MNNKLKVKVEDISGSPLFAGVPPKLLKKAVSFCVVKEYTAGSPIVNEGERGDFMFIIMDGEVDVLKGPKKLKLVLWAKEFFWEKVL